MHGKNTPPDSGGAENAPQGRIHRKKEFAPYTPEGYYFEIRNRRYWKKTSLGWQSLTGEDFQRYLNVWYGLSAARKKGAPSSCDQAMVWIQQNQWVNVVSDLAGYHGPAVITYNDTRILVPHGPRLVTPHEGDYQTILDYWDGMLPGDPGEHLRCWCAAAVKSAYAHRLGTNIIPILCGPHSCGKSLFQQLFTVAVGGRVSFPYQVMTGVTPFNEHLFAAEHLIIEDEYSSGDIKSRNQLGTTLKNFVANKQKLNHGKGKAAFTSPELLQFLTISLNDELENIAQLPRKHPSLDGKVSLYDCAASPMPMPTGNDEEKAAFWAQLMKELPCWIYDLLHKTPMPAKWRSGRFMVPWRAQKLSAALDELEPYMRLRDLIYILLWQDLNKNDSILHLSYEGDFYLGTPTEIELELRAPTSPVKALADDLCKNSTECGRLLTRLCEHFPREFVKRRGDDRIYQLIRPVPREVSQEV